MKTDTVNLPMKDIGKLSKPTREAGFLSELTPAKEGITNRIGGRHPACLSCTVSTFNISVAALELLSIPLNTHIGAKLGKLEGVNVLSISNEIPNNGEGTPLPIDISVAKKETVLVLNMSKIDGLLNRLGGDREGYLKSYVGNKYPITLYTKGGKEALIVDLDTPFSNGTEYRAKRRELEKQKVLDKAKWTREQQEQEDE